MKRLDIGRDLFPILGFVLTDDIVLEIDLSSSNSKADFIAITSVNSLQKYIDQQLIVANKSIAIGGYREHRNLYQRFPHFNNEDNPRCYHLGIDIWTPAGSPIYLPEDGVVHSQSIINLNGDYGGVILIEHKSDTESQYTLYGHLSHKSIDKYTKGDQLTKGTVVGYLGDANENGGWPPHLHFQRMKDVGHHFGDYPGVCSDTETPFYFDNCPNPMDMIK